MNSRIITECYFDTLLIEKIVRNNKIVWHRKGCNNVMESLFNNRIKDDFKVGIIDNDKIKLKVLNTFEKFETEGFNFYWNEKRDMVVIQLNPPLEQWILDICINSNFDLTQIGFNNDLDDLKSRTKTKLASVTPELITLSSKLCNIDNSVIKKLKFWLKYLLENKNNFDINIIKNK